MARALHYLEQPEAQGARRFGPLPDVVRIGADPDLADLTLADHVGIGPVGIELARTADLGWRLTLTGPTPHPCHIVRADGASRPAQPSDVLRVGETLEIAGSVQSPRLTLIAATHARPDPTRPEATAAPEHAAPSPPVTRSPVVGGALVEEVRRRSEASVVAGAPFVREATQAVRSGRGPWIAGAAAAVVLALTLLCAGVAAWLGGLLG